MGGDVDDPSPRAGVRELWLSVAGLGIGFMGSLCGIGGGLFASPLLHYFRGFALRRAVGTALVLVLATTTAATLSELARADSRLRWELVLALVGGVLVGAQLGFWFAQKLSERALRLVFTIVLAGAGVRILLESGASQPELVAGLAGPGAVELGWTALVGLAGGFVAPVLGVGGGLFMVPGLFLGIAGLGFDGARACSLAAGVVGSSRSLWLHARAGQVAWSSGLRLGLGAFLGAALGVYSLRFEGLIEFGRVALGLILIGTSIRFALDLGRGRREDAAS